MQDSHPLGRAVCVCVCGGNGGSGKIGVVGGELGVGGCVGGGVQLVEHLQ